MRCHLISLLTVSLLLLIIGCATSVPYKQADFLSNNFDAEKIDTITVMPVLDFRINKERVVDFDSYLFDNIEKQLKLRNYNPVILRDRKLIANIEPETLELHDKKWIASIDSSGARWILFVALLDSSSKLLWGTASAEMSAYIFDKKNSELIWQEKSIARKGYPNLVIGMLARNENADQAIEMATYSLITAIPVRKKILH